MFTRSKTRVEIDFDESSRAWLKNKKKLPNCTYEYLCEHKYKNDKTCKKTRVGEYFCSLHQKTIHPSF